MKVIRSFLFALIVAVLIFLGIYFFSPGFSHSVFGISWRNRGVAMSESEPDVEAVIAELRSNITEWGKEASLTAAQTAEMLKNIDKSKVEAALSRGVDTVTDSARNLFDSLRSEIGK
ncbi:hypothetical protein [Parasphaerochaeta coccoides]|uniref:Uncharacterized protein n=1 Tax=Parasphaerochaeta coccoides (strain ATCC BAA-1237 / DSM 17374 / SPN1) TaxID=760011 RepID=F4GHG3_PARC1|nr:hypothetical protein [Parasphaerochaeta coccoides]AEC02552.1 hypothetical protein Spico_1346 [Parasphaerochaeta coccoides DSM 17374]